MAAMGALAGCNTEDSTPPMDTNPEDSGSAFVVEPIPASEIGETVDCDVLVVGCGISGATALAQAAELGAKTIVIEKSSGPNGHGRDIASIGDALHSAAGVSLDPVEILADIMKTEGWRNDYRLVKQWANRSGEAVDWIENVVAASGVTGYVPTREIVYGGPQKWWEAPVLFASEEVLGNAALVPALVDFAKTQGAETRFETTAVQLVQDGNAQVTGVIAENVDGSHTQFNAGSVILATGGYESNSIRLEKYVRHEQLLGAPMTMPGITGDGHEMGLAVGAWENTPPHAVITAPNQTLAGFLRVNSLGERFTCERLPFTFLAAAIENQPGGMDWIIIPGNYEAFTRQAASPTMAVMLQLPTHPMPSESEIVELSVQMIIDYIKNLDIVATGGELPAGTFPIEGPVFKADSIAELATAMECDPETLTATVDRYNELAHTGIDMDFGNQPEWLFPVAEGPFYALAETTGIITTLDGLKINPNAQVLDTQGSPIPGLYACGNVSGGFFTGGSYLHHINGISHGRCITFGYLAARHAVLGEA